ncbi:hypothetical protein C8R43DRAFT_958892 [Mycena crocata]|nr:hypothetical protein C8R43DRAFT_958892 [Mycena crocata]
MSPFTSSLVACLLLTPLLAITVPSFTHRSDIAGLPEGATHLALDEDKLLPSAVAGRPWDVCAHKSNNAARRACDRRLRDNELRRCAETLVPRWKTLKDSAEKNWGCKKGRKGKKQRP